MVTEAGLHQAGDRSASAWLSPRVAPVVDRGRGQTAPESFWGETAGPQPRPNVPAIPVMLGMATWRPRHTACANSSTRPRRRFVATVAGLLGAGYASCAKRSLAGQTGRYAVAALAGGVGLGDTRRSHSDRRRAPRPAPICGSSSVGQARVTQCTWWRCNVEFGCTPG